MVNKENSFFQEREEVKSHYSRLANKYDESWEYSPDLVNFFSHKIVDYLELIPTDIFVDLGCGTGIYTKKIKELSQLTNPIICVDNSPQMIESIPKNNEYEPILMDAVEFTKMPQKYDKLLMKHMAHHIDNREELFKNLFNNLKSQGIILLVMMQPVIEYPLFNEAKKRCQDFRLNYKDVVALFEKVGLLTDVFFKDYPIRIEKERYFQMLRDRFLCLLSYFDDNEINKGIDELREKYSKESIWQFKERYLFVRGRKK